MPLPFRRSSRSAQGVRPVRPRPARLGSRCDPFSALAAGARRAEPWLLTPTDLRRWPPPESFEEQRRSISPAEVGDQTHPTASKLLRKELHAIRQTLDLPPDALSGLTRNSLLIARGIRLRQLEHWLRPFYAAREIKRMIA